MDKIFQIFIIFSIVFILMFEIPVTKSDVIISNNYPVSVGTRSPCITFDNSTNFYPYWTTHLNSYKDQAYMNLTSIWAQDIYVDDSGIVYYTDNYGTVFYYYYGWYYIPSPYYSGFSYAGPIVSIAVIDDSYYWYVALLTEYGYVFVYDMNAGAWFNASHVWGLTLQNVWNNGHSPWTSVTSNVLGDYEGYDELFIFTNLNGEVYAFDTTYNATRTGKNYSGWWSVTPTNDKIISTVAFYDEYRKGSNDLYGISFTGNVYQLKKNGWNTLRVSNKISNTIGITIGYSTDLNQYTLFIIQLNNNTPMYEYNPNTQSFQTYGVNIDTEGTNQAVTFDMYDSIINGYNYWYVLQTNDTIAYTTDGIDANSWGDVFVYDLYQTNTALKLDSSCPLNFVISLNYINSKYIYNMYNFTVYFKGSDNKLNLEFYYNWPQNILKNPANPANLYSGNSVLINFTYMPNMAYNSTIYFEVNLETGNAIIITYFYEINIINHYSYIPITYEP